MGIFDLFKKKQDSTKITTKEKDITEYVDEIKELKGNEQYEEAIELLLMCVDQTEKENDIDSSGVAPWYYEQMAIIYRKMKNREAEIGILERFARQEHANGSLPPKLLERLEKLKA